MPIEIESLSHDDDATLIHRQLQTDLLAITSTPSTPPPTTPSKHPLNSLDFSSTSSSSSTSSILSQDSSSPSSFYQYAPPETLLSYISTLPIYVYHFYTHLSSYNIISILSSLYCTILFFPLLLPIFISIYLPFLLFHYLLPPNTSPLLKKSFPLLLGFTTLSLLYSMASSEPPSWSMYRDDILLYYERQIDHVCGIAGRRIIDRTSSPLPPSSPPEANILKSPQPLPYPQPLSAHHQQSTSTCYLATTLSFLDHPNPYLVLSLHPAPPPRQHLPRLPSGR